MTARIPARAVSLDVWGTLLRSDPGFKAARNDMVRAALLPGVSTDDFDATMREADREADEICMGRGTDVGFGERVQLTLDRFDHPDAVPETLLAELMQRQAELARRRPPRPLHPELPATVRELAEAMPVVLTSNTGMLAGALMRELLALAGFDGPYGVVFSNEVVFAKPDPRIFDHTIAEVRRIADERGAELPAPGDVLHIGDNPVADGRGAREAGLRSVVVEPDGLATLQALARVTAPGRNA